jgi:hypothetical protein
MPDLNAPAVTFLGPYVLTSKGLKLHFSSPNRESIHPDDIAHHLAGINRYNGATKRGKGFYSVAQHCVLASRLAEDRGFSPVVQFGALLHDAPEAYTGDMVSPLKEFLFSRCPEFKKVWKELEESILIAVYARCGLEWDDPRLDEHYWTALKDLDLDMLAAERQALMAEDPTWNPTPAEDSPLVRPWSAEQAEEKWRQRYSKLVNRARTNPRY